MSVRAEAALRFRARFWRTGAPTPPEGDAAYDVCVTAPAAEVRPDEAARPDPPCDNAHLNTSAHSRARSARVYSASTRFLARPATPPRSPGGAPTRRGGRS